MSYNGTLKQFYNPERQELLMLEFKLLGLKPEQIFDLKWSQIKHCRVFIGKRSKKIDRELWIELYKADGSRATIPSFPYSFSLRDERLPFVFYKKLPTCRTEAIRYGLDEIYEICKLKRKNDRKSLWKLLTRTESCANMRVSSEAH